jgi:hypothetical protein
MDTIEEIKKLKSLLDQGAITVDEFDKLKKKILSSESDSIDFQKPDKQPSIHKEILAGAISEPKKTTKEAKKKSSSVKKPIEKGSQTEEFQEPNEATKKIFKACLVLDLLLGIIFWYRYDSIIAFFICVIISIPLTLITVRLIPKLSLRNFSLIAQVIILLLLISIPIGSVNNASNSDSSETSADDRPVLHCKWCKKVIIGEPHEDLNDYTIEPDGIGIIIFNSGTKYGYCSETCAKDASYAGYGYTQH